MRTIIFSIILAPVLAFAGSSVVYNKGNNPYLPKKDVITAQRMCYEQSSNNFKIFVPESTQKVCESTYIDHSDSTRPVEVCVNPTFVKVPAGINIVSRAYSAKECTSWDYSDSTRPVCKKFQQVQSQYGLVYTEETYKAWDYRLENPSSVKKQIPNCQ